MTITLPLPLPHPQNPVPGQTPSSHTHSATVPGPATIDPTSPTRAIPAVERFAPRTFRKTLSTPVHRTLPPGVSGQASTAPLTGDTGKDLLLPNLKRKLGGRAKTFEDLPGSSSSSSSSSSAVPVQTRDDQDDKLASGSTSTSTSGSGSGPGIHHHRGFGQVPDDVRYGLARTAQAVRRARRVIVVCG